MANFDKLMNLVPLFQIFSILIFSANEQEVQCIKKLLRKDFISGIFYNHQNK